MACNCVYAYLVAGLDQEARERFDKELYAPPSGWAELERRFFARLEGVG